ncbi:hypothetical protein OZZ17_03185 [[Ruminococcus] gnavus]|uniref:Uncharacterized protein n=1 Tax=Mediterraneibacter gnavus TaxID=33038 RepID=A0A9Q4EYF2_MEDGN|nr:hypothetical protein [Mediterraneibacter gnavus]MCZ0666539.1 hypothetical protein [Mediterraneibacter gnavus]
MIDSKIVDILEKYHSELANEISNINLAIQRIQDELKFISNCLMDDLLSYGKNTGIENKEKELELLKDSQSIREYINSFDILDFRDDYADEIEPVLSLYDVIVLNNTLACDLNHKIYDITVALPVLNENGDINNITVLASYCEDCNRYTITKDVFNNINGVLMCQVIDKTSTYTDVIESDIEIDQHESLLYRYGYNVKTSKNLSTKQRHIIIASLVESGIMTRNQISDHLTMLINRGEKIESWKDATDKWKQDRYYIQSYKTYNLPSVITNRILLQYQNRI